MAPVIPAPDTTHKCERSFRNVVVRASNHSEKAALTKNFNLKVCRAICKLPCVDLGCSDRLSEYKVVRTCERVTVTSAQKNPCMCKLDSENSSYLLTVVLTYKSQPPKVSSTHVYLFTGSPGDSSMEYIISICRFLLCFEFSVANACCRASQRITT
jgi:hypothetical protein